MSQLELEAFALDAAAFLSEVVDAHFFGHCEGVPPRCLGPVKEGECICLRIHALMIETPEVFNHERKA